MPYTDDDMERIKQICGLNVMDDVCKGRKTGVEENLKNGIVVPVLECLGWRNPQDMDFEHRVSDGSIDIALKKERRIPIIVECKSLEKKLRAEKARGLEYAQEKGAPWMLMTNGVRWELYPTFLAGVPRELIDPVFEIALHEIPSHFDSFYQHLSKENVFRIEDVTRERVERLRRKITEEEFLDELAAFRDSIYEFLRRDFLQRYDQDADFSSKIDQWRTQNNVDKEWSWLSNFEADADFALYVQRLISDAGLESSRSGISKLCKKDESYRVRVADLLRGKGIPVDWIDRLCFEGAYALLNRFLFLRMVEDRQPSDEPSFSRVAMDLMRTARDPMEVSNALKVLFQRIRTKFPGLYEGPLFDNILLEDIPWESEEMAAILRRTMEHDFAAVDRDILGEAYQNHVPRQVRKALGQFYTSPYIVGYIFDRLKDALSPRSRILDPACGSGTFLVEAYSRLKDALLKEGVPPGDAHRYITENSLYGVDIDSFAVQLTLMNLLIRDVNESVRTDNILLGNTLGVALERWTAERGVRDEIQSGAPREHRLTVDDLLRQGNFDLVVGNPPHHHVSKKDPQYRTAIESTFSEVVDGFVNIAQLFERSAVGLLKPGGYSALILPKPILWNQSYQRLREWLACNVEIVEITDLGKAWDEVGFEQVIVFAKRPETSAQTSLSSNQVRVVSGIADVDYLTVGQVREHRVPQAFLQGRPGYQVYRNNPTDPAMSGIYDIVEANTKPLGEIADIFRGYGRKVIREATSPQRRTLDYVPILAGGNIGAGSNPGAGKFTCWCLNLEEHEWVDPHHVLLRGRGQGGNRQDKLSRMRRKKVMCKRLVSSDVKVDAVLDAAVDREPYISFDTVTNVITHDAAFTPEYLLGILNSTLMTVYMRDIIFCRSTLTMDLDGPYLGQLPMKTPSAEQRIGIERVAVKIQELTQRLADRQTHQSPIHGPNDDLAEREAMVQDLDSKVFEIYGISERSDIFRKLRTAS